MSRRKSCGRGLGEGLERSEGFTDGDLGEPQSMNYKELWGSVCRAYEQALVGCLLTKL